MMKLFGKRFGKQETIRHPFEEIPLGSLVELTDTTTFALSESVSQTFEMKAYRRYESDGFLRYMYLLEGDEEVVLGVEKLSEEEFNVARFVLDSQEEFSEPLGSRIVMTFDDGEGGSESVQYERTGIIRALMTYVDPDGTEEYEVELLDYVADDGTIMMVEISEEDWVTYFIGEPISATDVVVYPKGE